MSRWLLLLSSVSTLSLYGTETSTWSNPAGGNWDNYLNWSPDPIPNGIDAIAIFPQMPTLPFTTIVSSNQVEIGQLLLNSTTPININLFNYLLNFYASGTATLDLISGSHLITAPIYLKSPLGITVPAGESLVCAGFIMEADFNTEAFELGSSFGKSVTKFGEGALYYTEAETYSGGTFVEAGSLYVIQAGSLNPTAPVTVNALFDISAASNDQTIGDLHGSGLIALGTKLLTFGTATPSTTFSGVVSGEGSIIKQGSGTTTFTGVHTYSGKTAIREGVLAVGMMGSLPPTTAVTIEKSATFDISPASTNQTVGALLGTGSVKLGTNTLTIDVEADTITFDGVISGSGAVAKTGSGRLILTGANTYTGATMVSEGILEGNSTSLQGTIVCFSTVVFNQTSYGVYVGSILGAGKIEKEGEGTLVLAAVSTSNSEFLVSAGTVVINNFFLGSGSLVVSPQARLAGTGIILQNITLQGMLSPGNSIGTISLLGNQVFESGSVLYNEVSPTLSDRVVNTGTLSIEPGAQFQLAITPGHYAPTTSYTVVASNTISGEFTNIINPFVAFTPTLIYSGTDVTLSLTSNTLSQLPLSSNSAKVALCLEGQLSNPTISHLVDLLHGAQSLTSLNTALMKLQPSQYSTLSLLQENNLIDVSEVIFSHLQNRERTCMGAKENMNFWIAPFAFRQNQSSYRQSFGYHAETPGFLIGFDGRVAADVAVGAAIGYSAASLDWRERGGHAQQQGGYVNLYSRWISNHLFIDTSLLYGVSSFKTDRHVSINFLESYKTTAHGNHLEMDGSAHLKIGGVFKKRHFTLLPFVEGQYLYLHEWGFNEHGAGVLNLHVNPRNSDLLVTQAGIGFDYCRFVDKPNILKPYLQLSAIYENRFMGKKMKGELNGCQLDVTALAPTRLLGGLKAGIATEFVQNGPLLNAEFKARYGHRFFDTGFNVELSYSF